MSAKRYAVVLHRDWVNELSPIVKPYLLPASTALNNLPVLYAASVVNSGSFFVVEVFREDNGMEATMSIPIGAIQLVFETTQERNQIGFIPEATELSDGSLSHLIFNG